MKRIVYFIRLICINISYSHTIKRNRHFIQKTFKKQIAHGNYFQLFRYFSFQLIYLSIPSHIFLYIHCIRPIKKRYFFFYLFFSLYNIIDKGVFEFRHACIEVMGISATGFPSYWKSVNR